MDAIVFEPDSLSGGMSKESNAAPIAEATWYTAKSEGDALLYHFPVGTLSTMNWLSADMLLDGLFLTSFTLLLQEGENSPVFGMNFGLLNQCSARMRIPLEAVNQNQWRYPREGAFLKPRCRDQRVDLRKVDLMTLRIDRKSEQPSRFCLTSITASVEAPAKLDHPLLPQGKLIDELGQSTLHQWNAKTPDADDLVNRLREQLANAPEQKLPQGMSRWGGALDIQFDATGWFRTHHDGERWWLVDPDGNAFWSSGLDCVRYGIESVISGLEHTLTWFPADDLTYADAKFSRTTSAGDQAQMFDYLRANFIRAFGADKARESWAEIVLSQLRQFGFNTVANWSDWEVARDAGMPYVRPLGGRNMDMPNVYRDFPDVFHPDFELVKAKFAEQLCDTVNDPAFIGYFLMNEPSWGFAQETPAAGMLYNTPECYSRKALRDYLADKYGSDTTLATAWKLDVTLDAVASGPWETPLTPAAEADLADFSEIMVTRYFGGLSDACREVDPHHLNLGIRYYTIPPKWCLPGMASFDVFSMNCYKQRITADEMSVISEMLNQPIMVGEWHFGALDAGFSASGIGHVRSQQDRGKAFRIYVEDAAAKPWCVGVHYFTLYDQSVLGRFDGEQYQIGFVDVCSQPYGPLAQAARAAHERLYDVATGKVTPFDDEPEYLPLLFL